MRLEITCEDRLGITQDVLDILVRHEIDLRGIDIVETGKIYVLIPNIEFAEFQHLMPEIRRIDGILDVKTTPYMPIEREKHQLTTLLDSLSDPVFSVDLKGRILMANNTVCKGLEIDAHRLMGEEMSAWVKGFSLHRWLDSKKIEPQYVPVKFIEQDFVAQLLPVQVVDTEGSNNLASAIIWLKSDPREWSRVNQQDVQFKAFDSIGISSIAMKKMLKEAAKVARLDAPLLISGESGTGKTELAKSCHRGSDRSQASCLEFDAAALSEQWHEAELFGYVAGSFGNDTGKTGIVQHASGGTLIIKNIDATSLDTQTKLLHLLEQGIYRSFGNSESISANVRLIFTTSKDLGQAVMDGQFSEQLYYRINAFHLFLPSLRERKQDIVPLAEMFVKQQANAANRRPPKLSRSCVDYLHSYAWPGNIRQLQNCIFRAVSLLEGEELHREDVQLPDTEQEMGLVSVDLDGTLDEAVKKFEKDLLRRLYPNYPSTRQLARKLGVSHTAIANKLRDYGINKRTVGL